MSNNDTDNNEKKSGGKGLIITLSTLVLGMGAALAWAVTTGMVNTDAMLNEPTPQVVMLEEPLFKPLDSFIVNLNNGYTNNYMSLDITLVSHDPRMSERADQMDSIIKNTMLKYFSLLDMEQVQMKIKNIDQLQNDLRHAIIDAAEKYGKKLPIEEVLLTNVVIQ